MQEWHNLKKRSVSIIIIDFESHIWHFLYAYSQNAIITLKYVYFGPKNPTNSGSGFKIDLAEIRKFESKQSC